MKKNLIFFLLFPFYLQAQSFFTLPDSNAIWTIQNGYISNSTVNTAFSVPVTNADTLIGSFTYKKVFVSSVGSPFGNGYAGCYRSLTNGFTYYVPKDSTQEFFADGFNCSARRYHF